MNCVPLPQRFYSGMPNGTTGIDIGGLQIQRSFSGSSCGSNGSVYSSSNAPPLRYPGAEIVFLHLLRLLMPEVFQLPLYHFFYVPFIFPFIFPFWLGLEI